MVGGIALIAIDTNLLVYAHRAGADEHHRAAAALNRAAKSPAGWGIAAPCLAEFWSVVTAGKLALPSPPDVAAAFISELVDDGGLMVWQPDPGFYRRLMATAKAMDVRGARFFDLQIALCAQEAGAKQLWTHDARFVGVAGLQVSDPLTPLVELP